MATTAEFSPLPQDIEQGNVQTEACLQDHQSHSPGWQMLGTALRLAIIGMLILGVALRLRQSQAWQPPPHLDPPSFLLNSLTIPRLKISDGELSATWDAELTISNAVNGTNFDIHRLDASIWYQENEALASITPIYPQDLFESQCLSKEAEQEKRVNLKFETTGWETDQPVVDDTVIAAMAEDRQKGALRFGLKMRVSGELSSGEWVVGFVIYPTCPDLEVRFPPPEEGEAATLIRRDSTQCSGSIQWGRVRGSW